MDNTLRKAAEMALKLLENNRLRTDEHLIPIVVDDLRQALNVDAIDTSATCVDETEKREHEPVAWVKEGNKRVGFGRIEERKYVQFDQTLPVGTKLYTAPPSKPWIQLSIDEVNRAADREEQSYGFVQGALWAEAALWSKNT